MALELDPATSIAGESADAGVDTSLSVVDSVAADSGATPITADPATQAAADETETARARRTAESERDELRAQLEALQTDHAQLKPYRELEDVAKKDVAAWIAQMAEASGIEPERVLEIVTKRGAGEPAALTPDERIAKLEKRLADAETSRETERAESEKRTAETRASETRKNNVGVTAEFIKANGKEFPGLDENDADSVFEVVEARWAAMGPRAPKDQAGLKAPYIDAAKRVEAAARAEIERRSGRFGYAKSVAAAKEEFRGLSLSSSTSPAPVADRDRVNTPDDIEAIAARFLN